MNFIAVNTIRRWCILWL